MKTYILFHSGCNDGITAASIVMRGLSKRELVPIPVKYGEPVPDGPEKGDSVWIVDFSYPRDILEELNRRVGDLVVLDHHATAEKELAGLPYCKFEKDKCGAFMAWEALSWGSRPPPHGLEMIQDRDLWTKRWPEETAAFTAGLGLLDGKPGDEFYRAVMENWSETTERGRIVVQYQRQLMDRLLGNLHLKGRIAILNSPVLQSDLGEAMLAAYPGAEYARIWHADGKKITNSLRSRPGSDVDVSAIAKQFGGGGHKHAAGYVVPTGEPQ